MICPLSSSYALPEPHQGLPNPWHDDVERWARTRPHGTEPRDPVWRIYTTKTTENHRELIKCIRQKFVYLHGLWNLREMVIWISKKMDIFVSSPRLNHRKT